MSNLEIPWTAPNGISSTYDLHCHCGAIRFKMTLSPPIYAEETQGNEQAVAVQCDCSHCERNGLLCFHPLAKDVEFIQGLEDRKEYLCASKQNPHWFCGKCGSQIGTDIVGLMRGMGMDERLSINARMLRDFDLRKVKTRPYAFKDVGPKYEI